MENQQRYLTFALGKGRLANKTLELFESIGITCEEMKDKNTRKLIFTNEELKVSFVYNQFCKRVFLSSAKLLGYNALRAFLILKKATCLRLQ